MKDKGEHARAILQAHFPDHTIIQVDPRAINWRGGGVHCWSQQQSAVRN